MEGKLLHLEIHYPLTESPSILEVPALDCGTQCSLPSKGECALVIRTGARTGDSAQCRATSPNTSRCTVQQPALYNSDGLRHSPTFHLASTRVWTLGRHSGSARVAPNDKCAPVKIPSSRCILQGQRIKSHSVNKQPRSWLVWSPRKKKTKKKTHIIRLHRLDSCWIMILSWAPWVACASACQLPTSRPPPPPLFSGTAPRHLSVLESPGDLQHALTNPTYMATFPWLRLGCAWTFSCNSPLGRKTVSALPKPHRHPWKIPLSPAIDSGHNQIVALLPIETHFFL